ncbi:MAG: hypothetical protein GQ544_07585 [Candidatus Aminicenantes bacterium]|nr:hypothetical protein [Candidatus Aminicenantes bacterium]
MTDIKDLNKEELLALLQDAAKNWLAHDGLWFQAVEKEFGMEAALKMDKRAWEKFTVIEAQRIMKFLGLKPGGGIPALAQALKFRLYAHINVQEILEISESRCVFRMSNCRVQESRKRKGLPDFPCKSVGLVEYSGFARTIDPRLRTLCLACPPDPHPPEFWCAWEFSLEE